MTEALVYIWLAAFPRPGELRSDKKKKKVQLQNLSLGFATCRAA